MFRVELKKKVKSVCYVRNPYGAITYRKPTGKLLDSCDVHWLNVGTFRTEIIHWVSIPLSIPKDRQNRSLDTKIFNYIACVNMLILY